MKPFAKEKLGELFIVLIIAALFIAISFIFSCTTGTIASGVYKIDELLSDGTLNIAPEDSPSAAAQKKRISAILVSAKKEIIESGNERHEAEKNAQKSAQWAGIGKGIVGVGIFLTLFLAVIIVLRIFKRISLPFL